MSLFEAFFVSFASTHTPAIFAVLNTDIQTNTWFRIVHTFVKIFNCCIIGCFNFRFFQTFTVNALNWIFFLASEIFIFWKVLFSNKIFLKITLYCMSQSRRSYICWFRRMFDDSIGLSENKKITLKKMVLPLTIYNMKCFYWFPLDRCKI